MLKGRSGRNQRAVYRPCKKGIFNITVCRNDSQFMTRFDRVNAGFAVQFDYGLPTDLFSNDFILIARSQQYANHKNKIVIKTIHDI